MPLPRFDFVCNCSDEYPASSNQISFGRGYQFASRPMGPDQITTRLHFPKGLWWFTAAWEGGMDNIDYAVQPRINMATLKTFYEDVRMYKPFEYVHPHRGLSIYRFSKPLAIPKTVDDIAPGGILGYRAHQTEPFELQMILQP